MKYRTKLQATRSPDAGASALPCSIALAASLVMPLAQAQTQVPAQTDAASVQQQVVVTASRYEQNRFDVPAASGKIMHRICRSLCVDLALALPLACVVFVF
jgi:hypothetical protein